MSKYWMIAYDIEDDRIRRKVSGILQDYGIRVQYSVFDCLIDNFQFNELRRRLNNLIENNDSLRFYPLCKWCRESVSWQGKSNKIKDQGFVIV